MLVMISSHSVYLLRHFFGFIDIIPLLCNLYSGEWIIVELFLFSRCFLSYSLSVADVISVFVYTCVCVCVSLFKDRCRFHLSCVSC